MVGRVEHLLVTWGERVGSLRPERRTYNMLFSDEPAEEFFEHAWRALREFYEDKYGPLDTEYIREVYSPREYCSRGGGLCPRHEAVFEVPIGEESNHDYVYDVVETPDGYKIYMRVGASGWMIYIDREKAAIKRPSGRVFVYRNYGPVSSYAYILAKFADALKWWRKALDAATSGDRRKMLELGFGQINVYEGADLYDYYQLASPKATHILYNDFEQFKRDYWEWTKEEWEKLERYADEWMERWRARRRQKRAA